MLGLLLCVLCFLEFECSFFLSVYETQSKKGRGCALLRLDLQKGDSKKLLLLSGIVGIIVVVAVDDIFGPISSVDPVGCTSLRHFFDRFVSVCFCLGDLLQW